MKQKNKHLIFVSCAGPPKGSPESVQVSKYLKYMVTDQRFYISLVTEKMPKKVYGWRTVETRYAHLLKEVHQVIRLPVYINRWVHKLWKLLDPGYFHKPDNESLFIKGFNKVKDSLKTPPDLIYSRSTPFSSALLALRLKQHYQIPWMMHLSDPWVESPHFKVPSTYVSFHEQAERECFLQADSISFTSIETLNLYAAKYPQLRKKFTVFTNVFDEDFTRNNNQINTGPIMVAHTGNLYGKGRRPLKVLKACQEIQNKYSDAARHLQVYFTGFISEEAQQDFKDYPNALCHYVGPKSSEQITKLQHGADVLLLLDWDLPPKKAVFQLSKTLDYLAARRPILAITPPNSTVDKLVSNRFGFTIPHNDTEGIYGVLLSLVQYGREAEIFKSYNMPDDTYAASKNAHKLLEHLFQLRS